MLRVATRRLAEVSVRAAKDRDAIGWSVYDFNTTTSGVWARLRDSLWFVPSLIVLAAVLLAIGMAAALVVTGGGKWSLDSLWRR